MQLTIDRNKLHPEPQTLHLERSVMTLIGKNGCGKSSILEALFNKYLYDNDRRVICFSSGQNELFTELFDAYKRSNKRYKTTEDEEKKLTTFYFDYNWVRALVFFASVLKPSGHVNKFLKDGGYIEIDETSKKDITSKLKLAIRVRKPYVDRIKAELKQEERGDFDFTKGQLRRSNFNKNLEAILRNFRISFDTEHINYIVKREITFDSTNVYKSFISTEVDEVFTFLSLASHRDQHIDIWNTKLFFKDDLEFKHLSDGEYQLLSIYALLDLFDQSETLFLFDEIDSHLYYENIGRLWSVLMGIKGKVLTTSHISESILNNPYENIKLVDKGKIETELTVAELAKRVSNIVGNDNYLLQLASRVVNVAIIDDESDWMIFQKLARRKLGDEVQVIFQKIVPFKRESGFNSQTQIFGGAKLLLVDTFRKEFEKKQKLTRNFILICDRDSLPLTSIKDNLQVNIDRKYKDCGVFRDVQTRLYSWKRMEIENYLLSISMLESKGLTGALKAIYPDVIFNKGSNLDKSADIRDFDSKKFIHPLYKNPQLNEDMLDEIIALIPPNEISADIETMYRQIEQQVNRQ